MAEQELEKKVEVLEKQLETMADQMKNLQTLLDIEEIKNLQKAYGWYLEHWMSREIIDCFSDSPDVIADFYPIGIWKGKEGVTRYFEREPDREFLHQIMQLSPIIHVSPDGKTAKGRWYGYGPIAMPMGGGVSELLHSGVYEMEYVKEDGIWKILKLSWRVNYIGTPGEGFVSPGRVAAIDPNYTPQMNKPDVALTGSSTRYPSGYIYPFHYNHPVTGKKTSENELNARLDFQVGK